jgi:hypothetical protein
VIEFQSAPDPVFVAILDGALTWVKDQLYPSIDDARPTEEDLRDVDEEYSLLYSHLARYLDRTQALEQVAKLHEALRADGLYRFTDYHWLLLYECLDVFCDLHNDHEWEGTVGPYTIDQIGLGGIVDRFFFDTDFAFDADFVVAREFSLFTVPDVSPQARKIAAGLKPDPDDLAMRVG